jgi:hypothetical protein
MEVSDKGYSPSPNIEIDKDEGYSPSIGSISIFFVIRTHCSSFSPSSDLRVSSLLSAFFHRSSSSHHTSFLSFLSEIVCGSNSQSVVRLGSLTNRQSAPSPH